jgi:hypothetical protein
MGETRSVCRILVGKPAVKNLFGKLGRRWDDNIKSGFSRSQMEGYGLDWSASVWGELAGSCECGNETLDSIKCWELLASQEGLGSR